MMTILENRVGNTPIIRLPDALMGNNPLVNVFAKLEYFNPSGSIKDRLITYWLTQKNIPPERDIVLASSGNSAASLSMFGCQTWGKIHIFTPESTSPQKLGICKAYGALIHLCAGDYEQDAADYAAANDYVLFDQYNDLLNVETYFKTLGPEIHREVPEIDYFVGAASTGGTISGVGQYFRGAKPATKIVLADPIGSILHEYMQSGNIDVEISAKHGVEGAGKNKITDCFLRQYICTSIPIHAAEAFEMSRVLSKEYGIAAGLSSGLIAAACREVSLKCVTPSNIVCVFPDSSARYIDRLGL
jgi:cystathionine beta-synthase